MMHARSVSEADDLTALFPDATGRRVNPEHVFVAEEDGLLYGGAILWHSGHEVAYLGAMRFTGEKNYQALRALMRHIEAFCRREGITELLHHAGTVECAKAFSKLGGRPVRRNDIVMSLRIGEHGKPAEDGLERPHTGAPSGEPITFRFLNPYDDHDREEMRRLIQTTGAIVQNRPWPWDLVFPTLGAWDGERLVGYLQFSVGLFATYDYGLRVDPAYRGQGLSKRLMALWLRVTPRFGCVTAVSGAIPGNTVMETLLERVGFKPGEQVPGAERIWVGTQDVFAWAYRQEEEPITWP